MVKDSVTNTFLCRCKKSSTVKREACSRNYTLSKWNLFCRSGRILSAHFLLSFFPESIRKYDVFWDVDTEWQKVGRKLFTKKGAGLSPGFGESLLWKCCTQYASKFGKLSSDHRTGKGQFSFQSQRKAMPKNAQTTAQLHSSHMLVK